MSVTGRYDHATVIWFLNLMCVISRYVMVDFSWTAIGFGVFATVVLSVCGLLYANSDRLEAMLKRCFHK